MCFENVSFVQNCSSPSLIWKNLSSRTSEIIYIICTVSTTSWPLTWFHRNTATATQEILWIVYIISTTASNNQCGSSYQNARTTDTNHRIVCNSPTTLYIASDSLVYIARTADLRPCVICRVSKVTHSAMAKS